MGVPFPAPNPRRVTITVPTGFGKLIAAALRDSIRSPMIAEDTEAETNVVWRDSRPRYRPWIGVTIGSYFASHSNYEPFASVGFHFGIMSPSRDAFVAEAIAWIPNRTPTWREGLEHILLVSFPYPEDRAGVVLTVGTTLTK